MKKLMYVAVVVLIGIGFSACEQEDIKPTPEEPVDLYFTDAGEDEVAGDRPSDVKK